MALLDKLFTSLNSNKGPTSSRVVGIDVGSSSIKVVEVQERNSVLTLTTYGEIQLGPYDNLGVGQTSILDATKEQSALVDVLRESAVKAKVATFAMPLASSFVTTMTIKAGQKEDISPRVRIEARKYIPVQLSEVTLDWAEIETHSEVSKTARDILLAAIQNDSLKRFNNLMEFVNLKDTPTEIECFSSIRAVYDNDVKNVAVIDLGASYSRLYISNDGLLQRMHRVRAGGKQVTDVLAKEMDSSFQDAEFMKRTINNGDDNYDIVKKAYSSVYDRPLHEFRQVIEEYEARTGEKVKLVYICGSSSLFPGAAKQIKEALGREVILTNPFKKVAYPAFMEDTITELGPTFTTALGAALRQFE